ncbi:Ig-like domain-containing protein [Methylosarcina fibrata]|uniref:Ig-like domain-containing protein n=1 Tax=Methylosarcina fibrata TaxID=105972 RepID=UPI0003805D52|nr:Ig-like domain-containing protein [Methylosarcina fibrata]
MKKHNKKFLAIVYAGIAMFSSALSCNDRLPSTDLANVSYGSDPKQIFDFYTAKGFPDTFVLVVHGGGWIGGQKEQFANEAKWFRDHGFPSVNMEYPTPAQYPTDPDNILRLLNYLQTNYGAQEFIIYGHSAGGHLGMLASLAQNVSGGFGGSTAYPAAPIVAMIGTSGVYSYDLLAGSSLTNYQAYAGAGNYQNANPINYVTTGALMTLLIAGDKDTLAPWQASRDLNTALLGAGADSEYHLVSGSGHGDVKLFLNIGSTQESSTPNPTVAAYIEAFLDRVMGVETPSNLAPTANTQSVRIKKNTAKTITLSGSDPEGNSLTYSIATQPLKGTLSSLSGSVLTYTPTRNVTGTDSFTFTANNGSLSSAPAKVSISISQR